MIESGEFVEVRMAGEFIDDERGQAIYDPVSGYRFPFPAESGLRTVNKPQYEYYLEVRMKVLGRHRWTKDRGHFVEKYDNPEWTNWRDGSGYNKQGSVYSRLSHVKGVISGYKQRTKQGLIDYEFRLFRRPVFTPPPWELTEVP
jgi:hypothetical protein